MREAAEEWTKPRTIRRKKAKVDSSKKDEEADDDDDEEEEEEEEEELIVRTQDSLVMAPSIIMSHILINYT